MNLINLSSLLIVLALLLLSSSEALNGSEKNKKQTYIVTLQHDSKPSPYTNLHQWYSSTLKTLTSENTELIHVYKTVFNGFAAQLTLEQSERLKQLPGVLSVFPETIHELHTTRSPEFMGLDPLHSFSSSPILMESDFGSDVIIGVLDTGIWPEHSSFNDKGMGPIPSRWKGECMEGENFTRSLCNRKLIGARYFLNGYKASGVGVGDKTFIKSARDSDGHGTHCASTAAGMAVPNASFYGWAPGVAVGVAPKARIAVYKVCWEHCFGADILAGFEKAIEDGVDVLSVSLGGGPSPKYTHESARGSFAATKMGIFVSCSAGNSGPGPATVANTAPWITTVGSGTIDRKFEGDLVLGDGRIITGESMYTHFRKNPLSSKAYWPLIFGGDAARTPGATSTASYCMEGSMDNKLVQGKIVMCYKYGDPVAMGKVVYDAGGKGLIVVNIPHTGEYIKADAHGIPGLSLNESAGYIVRDYIRSASSPKATMVFRGTQVGVKPAPMVAYTSSRGPSVASNYVLKPDLIAPGVNILAAWPHNVPPTKASFDKRLTKFNIISGTSMACPHVSGLAALLKGAHPDWSPAMIRSALMTTAYTRDNDGNLLQDQKSFNSATIWDVGAGHVDPSKAVDPGLVYDLTPQNYFDFLCASGIDDKEIKLITEMSTPCKKGWPWDLNYPAISVAFRPSQYGSSSAVVIKRTLTQVSDQGASTYIVKVQKPQGTILEVQPQRLVFKGKGHKLNYWVRITVEKPRKSTDSVTKVGKITWTNQIYDVVSPVIVTWNMPNSLYSATNATSNKSSF